MMSGFRVMFKQGVLCLEGAVVRSTNEGSCLEGRRVYDSQARATTVCCTWIRVLKGKICRSMRI
jgi:hypothetical protein